MRRLRSRELSARLLCLMVRLWLQTGRSAHTGRSALHVCCSTPDDLGRLRRLVETLSPAVLVCGKLPAARAHAQSDDVSGRLAAPPRATVAELDGLQCSAYKSAAAEEVISLAAARKGQLYMPV